MAQVIFTDNSAEALREFAQKLYRGAEAIGQQAVGYAKETTPVDTGRLRNSENYRVVDKSIHIGTDVEYAIYQELGTSKIQGKHFLKNAAANHGEEYKNILLTSLRS